MNILDKIIANTEKEVTARKRLVSNAQLERSEWFDHRSLSLREFIMDPNLSGIIAEVKKKSPSKGVINDQVSVTQAATGYEEAGASAISVLTDFEFFGGKMEYLTEVKDTVHVPVLRKDFIIDEYQLLEAKAIGADVILLIAACLAPKRLFELAAFAKSLGLSVLMEVHDLEELERSICVDLDAIGVNNRNLKTFDVSIQTSLDLVDRIPSDFVKVSESGLSSALVLKDLKEAGYHGFLMGEAFMKTQNPGQTMGELVQQL
jgi:indole-3-glycerol phosphate synthase